MSPAIAAVNPDAMTQPTVPTMTNFMPRLESASLLSKASRTIPCSMIIKAMLIPIDVSVANEELLVRAITTAFPSAGSTSEPITPNCWIK